MWRASSRATSRRCQALVGYPLDVSRSRNDGRLAGKGAAAFTLRAKAQAGHASRHPLLWLASMVVLPAAHTSPSGDRGYFPDHVPSGAALLALALSAQARGIRGLDVLRRSVDRAPPSHS